MAGIASNTTSKYDMARVKRELEEHGVAVVRDVIPRDTCDAYVRELRSTWLDKFSAFPANIHSIIHKYGIAHHPVQWKVRHDVRPVFEELWGTEKLLTSLDGLAIGRPPEQGATSFHVQGLENFHLDQGPHRVGLHAYQGAVYLEDATEEDWCFEVMDTSHAHFADFFQRFPSSRRTEFRRINASERAWLESVGCEPRRIAAEKGGVILWDSRTVHSGALPLNGRANSSRWRFVSFVCMAPAAWASEQELRRKVEGYEKLQNSSHWPCKGFKFFPSGRPGRNHVTALPPEAKTPQALRMVGVTRYDFADGKPNGPPKPLYRELK